jgi:hypothetical protein
VRENGGVSTRRHYRRVIHGRRKNVEHRVTAGPSTEITQHSSARIQHDPIARTPHDQTLGTVVYFAESLDLDLRIAHSTHFGHGPRPGSVRLAARSRVPQIAR